MRYIISIVRRTLFRDKLKFFVFVICLSLGMLIGAIFISQANYAVNSYLNYKSTTNFEDMIKVRVENHGKEMSEFLVPDFVQELYVEKSFSENIVFYDDKIVSGAELLLMSKEFPELLKKTYPITGRWFQNEKECLIGNIVKGKYGVELGEQILIGSNTYEVVGILEIPYYDKSIIIDESLLATMEFNSSQCNYYLKHFNINENIMINFEKYLLKSWDKYSIQDEKEIFKELKSRLFTGWTSSIIISVIGLIYGIINIRNIEKFYFYKKKKVYGIMLAYGARYSHIWLNIYLETGILAILSSFLTFIIVYGLGFTKLNTIITMKVDLLVFVFLFLIGQAYSLISSSDKLRQIKKKSIVDIFGSSI